MSFDVFLQGQANRTDNLPRKSDLLRVFEGHLVADEAPDHPVLRVGSTELGGWSSIYYVTGPGDPIQSSLMVNRPVDAEWLWDGLLELLRNYDLFMHWPSDPPVFVTAREDVPFPEDFPEGSRRRVDSRDELLRLIEES